MRFHYRVIVIRADVALKGPDQLEIIMPEIRAHMAGDNVNYPLFRSFLQTPGLTMQMGHYSVDADMVAAGYFLVQPPDRWTIVSDSMYVLTERIPAPQ